MKAWPEPGEEAPFTCTHCEEPVVARYVPGARLICPGCGNGVIMPPLPPWADDDE